MNTALCPAGKSGQTPELDMHVMIVNEVEMLYRQQHAALCIFYQSVRIQESKGTV